MVRDVEVNVGHLLDGVGGRAVDTSSDQGSRARKFKSNVFK